MSYKLLCNAPPSSIPGLVHPDGSWDMRVFERHLAMCAVCGSFSSRLAADLGEQVAGGREASYPYLNAAADLLVREAIDHLDASGLVRNSERLQYARELLDALVRAQGR